MLQLIEYTKPIDFMAKIKAGTGGSDAETKNNTSESPSENTVNQNIKRQNESDVAAEESNTVKKPRVLGPAMPPPS